MEGGHEYIGVHHLGLAQIEEPLHHQSIQQRRLQIDNASAQLEDKSSLDLAVARLQEERIVKVEPGDVVDALHLEMPHHHVVSRYALRLLLVAGRNQQQLCVELLSEQLPLDA